MNRFNTLHEHLKILMSDPGQGLYSINAFQEKKRRVLLELPTSNESVSLIGAPTDTGAGVVRGQNLGPLYLREYIKKCEPHISYDDLGDIKVVAPLLSDSLLNIETIARVRKEFFDNAEVPVSPLSILERVSELFYENFPKRNLFGIGGDHSISYPLVKSFLEREKSVGKNPALIVFDAHTDMLQSRQGIDITFGSWAYHASKLLKSPDHLIQIGIRDSGKDQNHWEKNFGIKQYWASEVLKNPNLVSENLISYLKERAIDSLYISFDIDVFDPTFAAATGTVAPNGLTPHEVMLILQNLFDQFPIRGADIVEIAPLVAHDWYKNHEPENTLFLSGTVAAFLLATLITGARS